MDISRTGICVTLIRSWARKTVSIDFLYLALNMVILGVTIPELVLTLDNKYKEVWRE